MNFLRFWFPVLLYSVIIFSVSSIPSLSLPSKIPNLDKLVHATEYGIFSVLIARALVNSCRETRLLKIWLLTLFFAVAYGVSDEFHQSFVPGRSCDAADLAADATGSALAAGLYLAWRSKTKITSVR